MLVEVRTADGDQSEDLLINSDQITIMRKKHKMIYMSDGQSIRVTESSFNRVLAYLIEGGIY